VALFLEGSLWYTEVLPIGGNHLTNDIAIGLRTPASEAEKIKIKYGCALSSLVKTEETLDVPSVGGRPPRLLSRQILSEIIEPRVEELFGMVQQRLKKTGFEDMFASGIVLTGGVALMDGVQEAAERFLGLPIRRGTPRNIGGLMDVVNSPIYATEWDSCSMEPKTSRRCRKLRAAGSQQILKWLENIFRIADFGFSQFVRNSMEG
jgi:cell division protein FtsA